MVCLFCRREVEEDEWKLIQDVTDEELDDEENDLVVYHERLGLMCLKHKGVRKFIKELSTITIINQ